MKVWKLTDLLLLLPFLLLLLLSLPPLPILPALLLRVRLGSISFSTFGLLLLATTTFSLLVFESVNEQADQLKAPSSLARIEKASER